METKMKNEEKADQIAWNLFDDGLFFHNHESQRQEIQSAILKMAKWKDEQHEQSLVDLNCKLEEQQANYEELKKRYDEAVEREKIATKIINELRQKLSKN